MSRKDGTAPHAQGAEYERVGDAYMQERQLTKHAGAGLVALLGVGYVIAGVYFSWNFGFDAGGWGGLGIAMVLMTIMYYGLVTSMSEMASALPHSGGPYSFARRALGPWGGFATGLGVMIGYVFAVALAGVAIAAYILALPQPFSDIGNLWFLTPIEWISLLFFVVFSLVNMLGVRMVFRVSATVAIVAVLMVLVWAAVMLFHWHASNFGDIAPDPGASTFLPHGISGIWAALTFAAFFFLAVEATPLASEEVKDPHKNVPRGAVAALAVIVVLAFLVYFVSAGVAGSAVMAGTPNPLPQVVQEVFGKSWFFWVVTVVGLTGLISSFHSIIFGYSRQLFALSRAGYVPRSLSRVSSNHTPVAAIIVPSVVGWAAVVLYTRVTSDAEALANITQISVFGALIYYILTMISFVILRVREPNLPRAYRAPLGVPGGIVTILLAVLALGAGFNYTTAAKWTLVATIGLILLGLAYFGLVTRHRLVAEAPEEEFALLARAEMELDAELASA